MPGGQVAGKAMDLIASGVHQAGEAGHMIVSGITEAVERVGELRYSGGDEEPMETFFGPVMGDGQVRVICSTGAHPDPVLRQLGVIEGRGYIRGQEVYFNAKKGQWVYVATNKEATSLLTTRGEAALKWREDRVPKGVIYITGTLQSPTDNVRGQQEVDTSVVSRIMKAKVQARDESKDGHGQDHPGLQNDDEYFKNLTRNERHVIFQQYLSSGVVDAARKSESCIVTQGSGPIAQCLSKGVFTTQDKGVSGGYPTSNIRANHTLLIGIERFSKTFKTTDLDAKFTHHVVVDRDTRPCNSKNGEMQHKHGMIIGPIEDLEADGKKDEAKRARKETETLLSEENPQTVLVGGLFSKKRCKGFRCRHVNKNYRAIVPDGQRAVHCRIRQKGDDDNNEAVRGEGEEDAAEFGRMRAGRRRAAEQSFIETVGGVDVWQKHCQRLCECGCLLGPFEVAQCVCGLYDFEHIPREVKRVRLHTLQTAFRDTEMKGAANKADILNYLAFMQCPVSREPSRREMVRFTDSLLSTLSAGFSAETDLSRHVLSPPPNRPAVPMVSILFGGDPHVDKLQIVRHVQHRWPILIVEGTGGYADVICGVVKKVREIAASQNEGDASKRTTKRVLSEAGIDEYRRFLTTIDSLTAEIIVNGRLFIIHKGTKNTEFARKLEIAQNGNETLEKSWFLHAQWAHNADIQQRRYFSYHWVINILSLLTVLLSVLQTFLLLTADTEPAALPTKSSFKNIFTTGIVWVVIVLPVMISFVQAVAVKDQAGAKSIQLQNAAEKLLSEIYMYRTWTLSYSPVELQKQLDRADAEHDEQGEHYTTREELLQIRSKELTNSLSESSVAGATLHPYNGPLPPRAVRKTGDDGFSDISPDDYVMVRLESRTKVLEAKTRRDGAAIVSAHLLINVCNASGTFCAALAAYGFGWMQPWVALTTALATSITLWVDHTKIEVLQQKLNVTINNLHIVDTWWVSLGAAGDTRQNRDKLVRESETFILEEAMRWGATQMKQKKTADGEKEKPNEPNHHAIEADQLGDVGTTHNVEVQGLTGKGLLDAIRNPDSHQATPVKQALKQLSERGLAPDVVVAKPDLVLKRFSEREWTENDDLRVLKSPCAGVNDSLSCDVLHVLKQPDMRNKLLEGLLRRGDLSRWGIKEEVAKLPQLQEKTAGFVTRKLLEVVKDACLMGLVQYFLKLEHLPQGGKIKFGRKELFAGERDDATMIQFAEVLISELHGVQKTDGVLHLDAAALVNILRDTTVKERFRQWPPPIRKAIRDAADSLWGRTGSQPTATQKISHLLDRTMTEIARSDIAEFLDSPNVKVELWAKLPGLTLAAKKAGLMSKDQLVSSFPKSVWKRLENKAHLQLQKYMEVLALGTPSSRAFAYQHEKYDGLLRKGKGGGKGKIFHPTEGDPEMRERLLIAVSCLDQLMINKSTKGLLLKKLRVHDVFNEECGKLLLDIREHDLKFLLSVMQSRIGNSYSSRLVDKVADEVSSFDVRSTISYYEAEKLVARISELKQAEAKLPDLPRIELLRILGTRSLVEKTQHLTQQQLVELFDSILTATTKSFPIRLQSHVKAELPELFNDAWSPEFFDSLSHSVASLDTTSLPQGITSTQLIGQISPSTEVTTVLQEFIRTSQSVKDPPDDEVIKRNIINIVQAVQKHGGERSLSLAFENTYIFMNAGGRTPGTDEFLEIFEKADTRRIATELLLTLRSLEVHCIGDGVCRKMSAEGEQQEAVLTSLCNVPHGDRGITGLLLELTIEAPLRIFHELADRCTTFDLRDVVTGNTQRHSVVLMLTDLLLSEDSGLFQAGVTPVAGTEALYAETERWLGRGFLIAGEEKFAPGRWKARLVKTAGALRDQYYEDICDEIRVLTELQLKILCEELYLLLTGTVSGAVFQQYVARGDPDLEPRDWAMFTSAIVCLRQKLRTEATLVETIFEHFDSKAFTDRDELLKEHLLLPVLDNEADREYISRLSAEEFKRQLVPYLHTYAPPTKAAYIESSKKVTKDAWGKLRKLRGSVAAFSLPGSDDRH